MLRIWRGVGLLLEESLQILVLVLAPPLLVALVPLVLLVVLELVRVPLVLVLILVVSLGL